MKRILFGFVLIFVINLCYAGTPPEMIMSMGTLSRDVLVSFLLENNRSLNRSWAIDIVNLYISEANDEGVNYEIAFAQMCYHTNYLSFDGTFAIPSSNNFYGASSLTSYRTAYNFDSYQTNIRAHIQHLKGYATKERLKKLCVDPRFYRIEEEYGWGSSPTINELSNKWSGADYANNIKAILSRIYNR